MFAQYLWSILVAFVDHISMSEERCKLQLSDAFACRFQEKMRILLGFFGQCSAC